MAQPPSSTTVHPHGADSPHADDPEHAESQSVPDRPADSLQTWAPPPAAADATRPDASDAPEWQPALPLPDRPPMLPPRYTWKMLLGRGGMGEVHRVTDHELERDVALKVLHGARALSPSAWAPFVREARLTAGLQHPGIIPVYDLGALPDGRAWYTMREVVGESLAHTWRSPPADGPTTRRRVTTLLRVCEAVGYAHDQAAIVHRDLKPANIMRGPFGEVLVLDWGLAVLTGHGGTPGSVSGTPAYMAPEQARGDLSALGPTADVWALGAMLVAAITGQPPHQAPTVPDLLAHLRTGPPPPPCPSVDPDIQALWRIAQRALSPHPQDRYATATPLAQELARWLDGSARRADALLHVAQADAEAARSQRLHAHAAALAAQATACISALPPGSGEADRQRAWDLEDAARAAQAEADDADDAATHHLRTALMRVPGLPEALGRLANRFRAAHAHAEAQGDLPQARRLLAELRAHDRGAHAAYLRGGGQLSLRSHPPGATVVARRYVLRGRRMELGPPSTLGCTPLSKVPLEHGSWRLTLTAPGRASGHLPVVIGRGAHVGANPDDPAAAPIPLPPAASVGPGEVYLPPGWFIAGGSEPIVDRPLPRVRRFAPPLIARRFPTTLHDLLGWFGRLCAEDNRERALMYCPRMHRTAPGSTEGATIGLDSDGRPCIVPDQDGDLWCADWPAIMVSWHGAVAIAEDFARWSGLPWRLPGELEWEWMARGADGRVLPWGTAHLAPEWCRMRTTQPTALPAPVDSHPLDQGPAGVRGTAGNVMEWCAENYPDTTPCDASGQLLPTAPDPEKVGPKVNVRGGAYSFAGYSCRSTIRRTHTPTNRNFDLGFRLVRSLLPSELV